MNNTIKLKCPICSNDFEITESKHRYWSRILNNNYSPKCSRQCVSAYQKRSVDTPCLQCGETVTKTATALRRHPNTFCSSSCAATYNNTHKTKGSRRSKLESYIEEQIRHNFPLLELICNDKNAIGSELDLYLPQLRFAIELNGIFHYEPIYGNHKLEQIQNNDVQKMKLCLDHGIELFILDTSKCNYLTEARKKEFWDIINNILLQIQSRAQ